MLPRTAIEDTVLDGKRIPRGVKTLPLYAFSDAKFLKFPSLDKRWNPKSHNTPVQGDFPRTRRIYSGKMAG
jgi:hypothetical protein